MQVITVNKADLIAKITENRETHRDQFLTAQERFREQVIAMLDRRLQQARDGRKVELTIRLPEPEDYTASYDTALAMLAWEQGDTVELDQTDFERYVENKWEWARHFAANTQSYLAS